MAILNDLMDWLGDVFFVEKQIVTTHEGYHTERYSYSGNQALTVQLPFKDTVTETKQVFNWSAAAAFIIVVLTFITVVTTFRAAVLRK